MIVAPTALKSKLQSEYEKKLQSLNLSSTSIPYFPFIQGAGGSTGMGGKMKSEYRNEG